MLPAPDKTKLLVFSYCAIIFTLGIQLGGFQLALLSAVTELRIDPAMIGLPITAQFLAFSVTPLIFGPVSDRIGKRIIIFVFMIVFIVGCLFVWTSVSAVQLLIGSFIIGAGASVNESSVSASVSDVFIGKQEKYLNFIHGFFCVGAVISPLILQALMDNLSASWRVNFLISAIVMAAIIPAILLARTPSARKASAPAEKQSRQKIKLNQPRLFIGFVICVFIYVSVESSIAFFADTVFTIELNSPAFGALAISLFWGSMGAGRLFFGRLRKIPKYTIVVCLFSLALIVFVMILTRHETVMLTLFALAGFACSCIWPGMLNAAASLNRDSSGAVFSYLNLGGSIGGAVVPLAVGIIMAAANMTASFLFLIALTLIAGVYILKKHNQ